MSDEDGSSSVPASYAGALRASATALGGVGPDLLADGAPVVGAVRVVEVVARHSNSAGQPWSVCRAAVEETGVEIVLVVFPRCVATLPVGTLEVGRRLEILARYSRSTDEFHAVEGRPAHPDTLRAL